MFGLPIVSPGRDLIWEIWHLSGVTWFGAEAIWRAGADFVTLAGILLLVVLWEERPLASIGLTLPSLGDVAAAVGAYAVSDLVIIGAFEVMIWVGLGSAAGSSYRYRSGIAALSRLSPEARLSLLALGAIMEEVGDRGYAIERLAEASGRLWVAALFSIVASTLAHVPGWGFVQAAILAPGLTIFVCLYCWRRNAIACVVAHLLADFFPAGSVLSLARGMHI